MQKIPNTEIKQELLDLSNKHAPPAGYKITNENLFCISADDVVDVYLTDKGGLYLREVFRGAGEENTEQTKW